jgi:2,3-bisphosphoglycerate-dependent phosphoglycerate mutase
MMYTIIHVLWFLVLPACHGLSALSTPTQPTQTRTERALTPTNLNCSFVTHTLLLCRHGDSIWNGGEPGCRETFTGWSDVPLSQKGIREAQATGEQLGDLYSLGIDVCCTSILSRAQLTAHYCLWGFAEKPSHTQPRQYVTDYRLNERHYGALQGYVKQDVENGMYGHDPQQVHAWRRGWYAVPPLLEETDPRRIQEIKKYQHFCGGPQNVPTGESLDMVAKNRIQPFLDERLTPLLNQAARRRNDGQGGTALVVAHANSLRALIGVLCRVQDNPKALQKLEAMKIPTGVPIMVRYQETSVQGKYKALLKDEMDTTISNTPLQYLSSSIILHQEEQPTESVTPRIQR